MATILHSGISSPSLCPYLSDREHQMDNRVMIDVPPSEVEALLQRGWRRFGPHYFRPACLGCDACVSIRIPVDHFQASKSQRRAWRKCHGIEVRLQLPVADQERLDLYASWHAERESARSWQPNSLDLDSYRRQFCYPHPCSRELAYFLEGKLVGVGIVDETSESLSSIYFFYSPRIANRSIGIASVLYEVEIAKSRGRQYVYLGYHVAGCGSLEYKAGFRPHQVLVGRPGDTEPPVWKWVQ